MKTKGALAQIDRVTTYEESWGDRDIAHELRLARIAIAELIEAAKDVNEWLCRTDREGTAHQQLLSKAIARVEGEAE